MREPWLSPSQVGFVGLTRLLRGRSWLGRRIDNDSESPFLAQRLLFKIVFDNAHSVMLDLALLGHTVSPNVGFALMAPPISRLSALHLKPRADAPNAISGRTAGN
ncbi:hypothetical protein RAD15_19195 [Bradyrhizobium sp. 14AA]